MLLEDVVDGSQQHSCNGDDSFLMTTPLFKIEVAVSDFGSVFIPDGTERALDKQRLYISPGSADPGSLFLPGTLVVLRCKPSPRAEML